MPTQPPTLSGMGTEYRQSTAGEYGHIVWLIPLWIKHAGARQATLSDPSLTCVILLEMCQSFYSHKAGRGVQSVSLIMTSLMTS